MKLPHVKHELTAEDKQLRIQHYLLGVQCLFQREQVREAFNILLSQKQDIGARKDLIRAWKNIHNLHYLNNKLISCKTLTCKSFAEFVLHLQKLQVYDQEFINEMKLHVIKNSSCNKLFKQSSFCQLSIPQACSKVYFSRGDLFVDQDPLEVCSMITDIMIDLTNAIDLLEFVNMKWTQTNKKAVAPTVSKIIEFHQFLSGRISTEILSQSKDTMGESIEFFVELAHHAHKMHNFELVSVITNTLDTGTISRLKSIWFSVSKKCKDTLDDLKTLTGPKKNYKCYRELIAATQSYVPIISVILHDVVAFYDCNKDCSRHSRETILLFGKILYPINQLQASVPLLHDVVKSHSPTRIEKICTLLKTPPLCENVCYHLSYQIEPFRGLNAINEENEPSNSRQLPISLQKPPEEWNEEDVRRIFAYWNVSEDIISDLVPQFIPDGIALLNFQLFEYIPTIGARKKLQREINSLKRKNPEDLAAWTLVNIARWLRSINHQNTLHHFVNISGERFKNLTENDLIDLGITTIGVRKSLFREHRKLGVLVFHQ